MTDAPRTTYTEHPMFVPFAGEHLGSILTLPDSDARGVVLLLQGLGASRSHKNRVWTRLARTLAEDGIASVRMDYPDLGDSTGRLRADLDDPPVEEAEAVVRQAMEASGTDTFAVVGNCMGLRAGFALASRTDDCISVASILLGSAKPLLRGQGFSPSGRAVKRATKRLPTLARTVRRLMPHAHLEQRLRFLPEVEAVLRTRGGYFLFFGRPEATGAVRTEPPACSRSVRTGRPPLASGSERWPRREPQGSGSPWTSNLCSSDPSQGGWTTCSKVSVLGGIREPAAQGRKT